MNWYRRLTIVAVVAVFAVGGGYVSHAKPELGKAAPDFELKDDAGKAVKLSDLKGKPVVVEFWNHGCPWIVGTEKDRKANIEKYGEKVVFLSIDPTAGNTAESRKAYMDKHESKYTLLVDADQTVANEYGANQTPEIFIVDKEGTLVYHGAFDNRNRPGTTGETNHIGNTLEALAEGKAVDPQETKAFGCNIARKAK